ncbi:MAG: quinone oxidoreductase family protein [Segniliparus sp.]|uniref:quinone oxidoreductase family protein n=1 Tax=Segniliparus sp. TaxID=2804064 RepID=UPI003F351B15
MVKTIVAARYGGPEVLEIRDVELPAPSEGEVLVDVRAAGANPVDWKLYSGVFGTESQPPLPVGLEAAGVVAALGPNTAGFAVGDEVLVYGAKGVYAERVLAPVGALFRKPAPLDWAQASGLLSTGVTAALALDRLDVKAGEVLLVHGAAGGVGLVAVQLAVARGAKVVGTASPGRHARLRELGAEPVEYGPGLADRIAAVGPVDAALDLVGTDEALDVSLGLVPDRARILTIVRPDKAAELGFGWLDSLAATPEQRASARDGVLEAAESGVVVVDVDRVFALDQAADAHRYLIDGHAKGKIVLVP